MVSWELPILLTNGDNMVSSLRACQNMYAWLLESITSLFWPFCANFKVSSYLVCQNRYAWFLESCHSFSRVVKAWFLHIWHVKTVMHGFLRAVIPSHELWKHGFFTSGMSKQVCMVYWEYSYCLLSAENMPSTIFPQCHVSLPIKRFLII